MKIKIEGTTRNADNTYLFTTGIFDTDVEGDGERFLDVMEKAAGNPDDFIRLLIERIDDAEGNLIPT